MADTNLLTEIIVGTFSILKITPCTTLRISVVIFPRSTVMSGLVLLLVTDIFNLNTDNYIQLKFIFGKCIVFLVRHCN